MTRYLTQFFAVVALVMLLVAGINVAVDPNGVFRQSWITGFNDQKTLKGDGGRGLKSLILRRHRFDALFFGTSQAEVGLDPASPVLGGQSCFNASLSFSNMHELTQAMAFAARHQQPRLVVIALDFVAFSGSQVISGDFAKSGFAGVPPWPAYARRIFSAQSLEDSFSVLRKSQRGKPQFFTRDGHVDPAVRGPYDRDKEFHDLIASYLVREDGIADPAQRRQTSFLSFHYEPARVDALKDVVRTMEANGAQVQLLISPVHAWYLDAMVQSGLQPSYEQWKRDLTTAVADIAAQARHPVQLWDFSGYNAISTETVPAPGSRTAMRWYWDPTHFTTTLGNVMLARMLGQPVSEEGIPGDFGTALTPANIETALARFRQGQRQHAARDVPTLAGSQPAAK